VIALGVPAHKVGAHGELFEVVGTELVADGEEAVAGILPGMG
jgi:hypothetical protein